MYLEELKKLLTNKRYEHVIRVKDMAILLSKKYNIYSDDIVTAALLHDIAKYFDDEYAYSIIEDEYKYLFENGFKINAMLHGFAGASYIKEKFSIVNEDILNSIRFHTIGRDNMSLFEKIIYLSDAIELGRNFEGVEEIRKLAFENINKAILLEINLKIKYLLSKNSLIHPNILLLRNELLQKEKNNE